MIQQEPSLIEKAIRHALNEAVTKIALEEIDATTARIRQRVMKEMDALALQVLGHYDISQHRDRIVIEVRKPIDGSRRAGD